MKPYYTKEQNNEITAFGDEQYDVGFDDGVLMEYERIIKVVQDRYDYLIDTYGISIVKDQLDLLLELMSAIERKG